MDVKIYSSRFILEKSFDGSTALTHRFLIASWLANEQIFLDNVPTNDDINATIDFLNQINTEVLFTSENSCYLKPKKYIKKDILYFDVKNSTSSLRFLLPVALNFAKKVVFKCDKLLINKSLDIYKQIAEQCNCIINKKENEITCSGSISLDFYEVDGKISSQFITGLIINAIYNKKAITIKVIPPFENKKYVLMSIEIFKLFGFDISINDNTIIVHTNNISKWDNYFIEGDYSIAANYIALACLNGSMTTYNLTEHSLQSEKRIVDILKTMGGNIRFLYEDNKKYLYVSNNSLLEKGVAKQLKACDIDICDVSGMIPLVMVICSFSNGISKLYNLNKLEEKELIRLNNMINNLKQLGVSINIYNDYITIKGKKDYYNSNVTINSFGDHRIAMAVSIFSLINNGSIIIKDADCVSKIDPNFFNNLTKGTKQNAIQIL